MGNIKTNMSVFMNPLTDWGFKTFFEKNKASTIEFLNDLLGDQEEIINLEFLDKEIVHETNDGRTIIYDLYCKTADGRRIIIEMQRAQQQNFKERAFYYMCRNVVLQGEPGKTWDYQLDAVYGVFFIDFSLEERANEQLIREVLLFEKNTKELFYKKFRMYFIELPLFEKKEKDCKSKLDCWIYLLKNMEILETMPFKGWLKTLDELEETMRVASLDKNGRELYEASLKQYRDLNAVMEYHKNKYINGIAKAKEVARAEGRSEGLAEGKAEGKAEGLAEGRAEGLAEGRAEGLAEGRAEGKEEAMLDIARNLKSMNLDLSSIQKATGLSEEEIIAL